MFCMYLQVYTVCIHSVVFCSLCVCVCVCVLTTCLHDVRRLVGMLDEVREKVVYGGETGTYNVCIYSVWSKLCIKPS